MKTKVFSCILKRRLVFNVTCSNFCQLKTSAFCTTCKHKVVTKKLYGVVLKKKSIQCLDSMQDTNENVACKNIISIAYWKMIYLLHCGLILMINDRKKQLNLGIINTFIFGNKSHIIRELSTRLRQFSSLSELSQHPSTGYQNFRFGLITFITVTNIGKIN